MVENQYVIAYVRIMVADPYSKKLGFEPSFSEVFGSGPGISYQDLKINLKTIVVYRKGMKFKISNISVFSLKITGKK